MIAVPELERETLIVSGVEGRSWLNGLVSCDLSTVDRTRGAYGLLLTKQGKIQTDLEIVLGDAGLYLSAAAGTGEEILATLGRYLVMEDAELALEPELVFVRILGGESDATLARIQEAGSPVVAQGRLDWFGTEGAALVVPRSTLGKGTQELLEQLSGEAWAGGLDDWNQARVSNGFPEFGVDYTPEDNPHEAGLDRRAVSFSKGCYLGQEVVCMQDLRGRLKRRIVALKFAGGASVLRSGAIAPGVSVLAEGIAEAAGRITSVAVVGGDGFALARLRAPFFQGGSQLSVAGNQAEIVAPAGRE